MWEDGCLIKMFEKLQKFSNSEWLSYRFVSISHENHVEEFIPNSEDPITNVRDFLKFRLDPTII